MQNVEMLPVMFEETYSYNKIIFVDNLIEKFENFQWHTCRAAGVSVPQWYISFYANRIT